MEVISIIGEISITIEHTNNQAKKDIDFATIQENENIRLEIATYIKYEQCDETLKKKHYIELPCIIENDYNTYVNTYIIIKNIGMDLVINFDISSLKFNNKELGFTIGSYDVIEKYGTIDILFDFRLNLEDIKQENLIKASEGSITKFYVRSYDKGGKLDLLIGYNDLLENKYE